MFHKMDKETKPVKGEMAAKGLLPWVCLALLLFTAPPCHADNILKTKSLMEKATISYRIDFSVDSSLIIWNKLLDHPLLMGKLWNLYNFQPAYEVTKTKDGVKVVDPSGIIGEISLTDSSPHSRTFYGRGEIDHWAVPSFISAEGVFLFRHQEDGQHVKGSFEVYLKGDNDVADLLMKLFSGTLKAFIHSRFTNNLEDVKKILFDLRYRPEEIRKRLYGNYLEDFMLLLPKSESSDQALEKDRE